MSATKPLLASSSGIGTKIVGAWKVSPVMLVKSSVSSESTMVRRRVAVAEELQPAALVARALRQHQMAGRRSAR